MIPQIEPWIDDEELTQLRRVIASNWLVEHELTAEFEARTRDLTGAAYALATANGTVALFCVLRALGIGPGDEVIVPDLTFIATANAVIMAGARPVFCDIRRDTYCLDAESAATVVTPRTKAILPVHLYGQAADMEAIATLATRHGLRVIEDAAQGVGVRFNGRHVGTFGDAGALSYYGNKTITCGEGGMILTNSEELRRACYRLKNHGRDRKGIFEHESIGFNFCFTELQAAVGLAQMNKLDRIVARKAAINARYRAGLGGLRGIRPVALDPRTTPVHWFTSVETDDRDELAAWLTERGIETRRFFLPLHRQPCYADLAAAGIACPVADEVYARGLSLPSSYGLTDAQLGGIVDAMCRFDAHRH